MNKYNTHLIQNFLSSGRSVLSRMSSGQVIGYRNANKIMFGENPMNLGCWEFISDDHAMQALKRIAALDQAQRIGKVCKDCGMPPAELSVCPSNPDGAHRTEMRAVPAIEVADGDVPLVRVH